jgi:predicted peroxiredoxin
MARKLVVRVTHGPDNAERAAQGLTVASSAIASGVAVELWLMNDGVSLGQRGALEDMTVPHSPKVTDLWTAIAENAVIYACSPCLARRDIDPTTLRDGITPAGAAAFVASVTEDGVTEVSF